MTKALTHVILSAAVALTATLTVAAPAQAASYRQLKTVQDGTCLRAGSTASDLRARSCAIAPTAARDWQVILIDSNFNGHPVWQLKNRSTGRCLSRVGTTGMGTLGSQTCTDSSNTYWEIFKVASTAIVLKSFGAFALGHQHACLQYEGGDHVRNVDLVTCNTNRTAQRWRS
jgi:Ricin-type beta-trefoil lectin domain